MAWRPMEAGLASGIVFVTYATLRSEGGTRLTQILDWMGAEFDGVSCRWSRPGKAC